MRPALMLLCVLLSAAAAAAQSTQPALRGMWIVRVTPTEPAQADGAVEADHTLTFTQHDVRIAGPLGEGFGPSPYEAAGPDFRIILRHEKLGTVLWTGALEGDALRGLVRWTRKDGKILTYRFAGSRAGT